MVELSYISIPAKSIVGQKTAKSLHVLSYIVLVIRPPHLFAENSSGISDYGSNKGKWTFQSRKGTVVSYDRSEKGMAHGKSMCSAILKGPRENTNERHLRKLEIRFISKIRTTDNQIFTREMQVEKIDF